MTTTFRIAIIVLALAAAVPAQNASFKAAAEREGLDYKYDKFKDVEGAFVTITPNLWFTSFGNPNKPHAIWFGVANRPDPKWADDAIFLIDGRRLLIEPEKRIGNFQASISDSDFKSMATAKLLALQVGSFEHEFTPAEVRQLAALLRVSTQRKGD